jgi:DNA gyrase/topoisomerase IV subunit B
MSPQAVEALRDWDPLSEGHDDPGIVLAAQKREIGNILKSYTGYYDLFAELVQNALDAVEKRLAEADPTYSPSLEIAVNIRDNTVTVADNGCGMNLVQFNTFLKPNFSSRI